MAEFPSHRPIVPEPTDALLLVDVQNDFVPGGSLPVPRGDDIVPLLNRLVPGFATVIATQDWHPPGHLSFAAAHSGRAPFTTVDLPYGPQMLWPDHCVQGSEGAALVAALDARRACLVLRKGCRRTVDSYSAFAEADGTPTGLAGYLRERGIVRVFVAGLATDFCVRASAVDAAAAGFATVVIEDACRGIDARGSLAAAWRAMAEAGVARLLTADLALPA
jgi:nicotinamidase/pyrazinamidase